LRGLFGSAGLFRVREKQKGAKNFRTEGLKGLKELTLATRYELIVPIEYKGFVFEEPLRLDLLVDDCPIVQLKAVEKVLPIHKAQLLSYMKLLNKPSGLLIDFHETVIKTESTGLFSESAPRRSR
jgi:GxxExxY protein